MKISDLEQVNNAGGFDIEKDKLIIESDGACHYISMSDISKSLDIRRRESNRTAWSFIDFADSVESLPATDTETGTPIVYGDRGYKVEANSLKSITFKIAGFEDEGKDPPTGAKRVMLMAKVQNLELITRFRSEQMSVFRVGAQESAVLFMLENIQDVILPTKIIPQNGDSNFETFGGMAYNSHSGGQKAKNFYINLNSSKRATILGPIMGNPNLLPSYNKETGEYVNLDPLDQVTVFLRNSNNSDGYINSIRTIAWSY